jgi:hypothetical protein
MEGYRNDNSKRDELYHRLMERENIKREASKPKDPKVLHNAKFLFSTHPV